MDEKELLKKAHSWFTITYEKTAEQADLNCVKIWYKPIMKHDFKIYKYPEVVFGPSEKEVNALIKTQSIIRWGIIATILLLFLISLIIICFVVTFKFEILIFGACIGFVAAVVFACLPLYLKPYEKLYRDKVITYMDKQ